MPKPNVSVKPAKREITPESVAAKVRELLQLGVPRKLIVNIGPGKIQDAHVEHKEYLH